MTENPDPIMDAAVAEIEAARFNDAVKYLEQGLAGIVPATPLHAILGRDFQAQRAEAVRWLTRFHDQCSEDFEVTVLYVEMNRFEINNDEWYVEAFAFSCEQREAFEDLGMFERHSEPLVLRGMAEVQEAMQASLTRSRAPSRRTSLSTGTPGVL